MGYQFSSRLTDTLNLCLIYFKITWTLAKLLEHKHKKFDINQTKIKGSCQSGRKVVTHNSKSDLPLGPQNEPNWHLIETIYQAFQTKWKKRYFFFSWFVGYPPYVWHMWGLNKWATWGSQIDPNLYMPRSIVHNIPCLHLASAKNCQRVLTL